MCHPKKSQSWFVYILRCRDNALYTGIAKNIENRVKKHNQKRGSKSVIAHGLPVLLVYSERCSSKSEALKREARIKKLSKTEKEFLLKS